MPHRNPLNLPTFVAICLILLSMTATVQALIIVGRGNDPVQDGGWPVGALAVANLKSRVGWWEGPPFGGGQHCFLYRGGVVELQAAVDLFAGIKADSVKIVLHEGPEESYILKDSNDPKSDARVDWSFMIWNPDSYNALYNNPKMAMIANDPSFGRPMPPPQLDVYIGGKIDWAKIKVPAGVVVADARASANGFAGGSAFVGDVVDGLTNKPIDGAAVVLEVHKGQDANHKTIWDPVAKGTTDAKGHVELLKLPAGYCRLQISAAGAAARVLDGLSFKTDTLERHTIRLLPPATISGRVTDTEGKPMAGVSVRADSIVGQDGKGYPLTEYPVATTDADGKFTIAGLPRGHCQLFTYSKNIFGLNGQKTHDLPSDGVAIRVTMTGSISVKVRRADGTPPTVQWATEVEPEGGGKIGSWGGSANLKPDGGFTFENVPPGKYVVGARPNPGSDKEAGPPKVIEVKAGATKEVSFDAK